MAGASRIQKQVLAKTALAKSNTAVKLIDATLLEVVNENKSFDLHGVVEGMDVSKSGANVVVASGIYYVNGKRIVYGGGTIDTSSITEGFGTLLINDEGTLSLLNNDFPSVDVLNNGKLELSAFSKPNASTINKIGNSFFTSIDFLKKVYLRHKFFEGTIFALDAGVITTTGLAVNIQGGNINTPNAETKTITTATSIVGQEVYRVDNVYTIQPEATISLNSTEYDNGNLTALANNKFVVHTIARSSRTDGIYVIIGDTEYNKLEDAINADYNLGLFSGTSGTEIEPLANVVIEKDGTEVSEIIDLRNSMKIVTTSLASAFDSRLSDLETRVTALENA